MKIVQVISHYLPAIGFGGALQVAHGLGRELVRKGHEVVVITSNQRDPSRDLDVPVDEPVEVDGVKVFYEPVTWPRYWGYSPMMRQRTRTEVADADAVFGHFHYQYASVLAGRAARSARKPYVAFSHGSLNRHNMKGKTRLLKKLYLHFFERPLFKNAHFSVYHSEVEYSQSVQFGGRTEIVPIGIDPGAFSDLPPEGIHRGGRAGLQDKLLVSYLGRLTHGKGLELLLPAFKGFLKSYGKPAHLTLIGGDERGFEAGLRAQVEDLGMADDVTFTGLLSGRDKLAALQDTDIFVLPSRSEGTSLATMEAMYMKLPVIVSDRVGLSGAVTAADAGVVCGYDSDSIKDALNQMSADGRRHEKGERGHRLIAEKYTWSPIADDLLDKISK